MPQVIPSGFGMAHMLFQADGSPRVSSFGVGFMNTNDSDPGLCAEQIAVAAVSEAELFIDTNMVVGWTFLGCDVTVETDTGPLVGSFSVSIAGIKSGTPVPANSAHLVSKRTNLGGRQGRGRCYVPPVLIPEASIDAMGFASSGLIATQQGLLTAWFSELVTGELPPYLFHSAPVTPGPTPMTGFILQSQLATQRRRLRK